MLKGILGEKKRKIKTLNIAERLMFGGGDRRDTEKEKQMSF